MGYQRRVHGLLITIAAAMALLALSRAITDAIMLYFVSDRHRYGILKFQQTQHFGEFRDMQAAQRAQMKDLGLEYDETQQKPCPVPDFLSDIFEEFRDRESLFGIVTLKEIEELIMQKSANTLDVKNTSSSSWQLDILAVMVRHEMRLNRLDGIDQYNLDRQSKDRLAKFYKAWEHHYWTREGWGQDIFRAGNLRRPPPVSPDVRVNSRDSREGKENGFNHTYIALKA